MLTKNEDYENPTPVMAARYEANPDRLDEGYEKTTTRMGK
jgi:hypothetical protein